MTDKEWAEAMTEIQNLRYQLTHNITPAAEREDTASKLRDRLYRLARRDQP